VWFRLVSDGRPLPAAEDAWGDLTPDNVRLAHRLCNRRDFEWRTRINALLGKRISLEEIAAHLNAKKVPTIHGTNRWTASSVSKAFVS
jgi:DNA-binding transcriptional MerR regulator